MYYFLFQFIQF